jgi:hypothetical protein
MHRNLYNTKMMHRRRVLLSSIRFTSVLIALPLENTLSVLIAGSSNSSINTKLYDFKYASYTHIVSRNNEPTISRPDFILPWIDVNLYHSYQNYFIAGDLMHKERLFYSSINQQINIKFYKDYETYTLWAKGFEKICDPELCNAEQFLISRQSFQTQDLPKYISGNSGIHNLIWTKA